MAVALPIYAAIISLPVENAVSQTILASCPAAAAERCMATADLLQAVGSFYDVVIIVLIALLAAVVSLVYLTIKASSKRQIEEQLEQDLEAPWFQHRLQQKVDIANQLSITELVQRIEVLENALSRASLGDRSEELNAGESIVGSNEGSDDGAR